MKTLEGCFDTIIEFWDVQLTPKIAILHCNLIAQVVNEGVATTVKSIRESRFIVELSELIGINATQFSLILFLLEPVYLFL